MVTQACMPDSFKNSHPPPWMTFLVSLISFHAAKLLDLISLDLKYQVTSSIPIFYALNQFNFNEQSNKWVRHYIRKQAYTDK